MSDVLCRDHRMPRTAASARVALTLAAAVLLVWVGGCTRTMTYMPICGPGDLSQAQVAELLELVPPQMLEWRGVAPVGEDFLWVPFVTAHVAANTVYRGGARVSGPPRTIMRDINQKWFEATKYTSFGPLALPWAQMKYAYFEGDGKNFGYYRTSAVLWGILWRDRLSRNREPDGEETHSAGLLFGGFGYGSERNPVSSAARLRLFWIPITLSQRAVASAQTP